MVIVETCSSSHRLAVFCGQSLPPHLDSLSLPLRACVRIYLPFLPTPNDFFLFNAFHTVSTRSLSLAPFPPRSAESFPSRFSRAPRSPLNYLHCPSSLRFFSPFSSSRPSREQARLPARATASRAKGIEPEHEPVLLRHPIRQTQRVLDRHNSLGTGSELYSFA